MDHIRLIASDMDATLLDGHSQLPPDFLHLVSHFWPILISYFPKR